MDLRPRDPRMLDVAHYGDLELFKFTFVSSYRKHIEHRLGRVGMTSVAGVNDADMRRDLPELSVQIHRVYRHPCW